MTPAFSAFAAIIDRQTGIWYILRQKGGDRMFRLTVHTPSGVLEQMFSQTICLSEALEAMGVYQSKPCGGHGKCGKCKVVMDGKEVLSCQTQLTADVTVVYDPGNAYVQGITEGAISHI